MCFLRCWTVLLALAGAQARAADLELLRLLMPDARLVAGLDMDSCLNSALGRFLVSEVRAESGEFRALVDATGFNPRRDLREILIAARGSDARRVGTLIVARGSFAPWRVVSFLRSAGYTVTRFQGLEIIQGKNGEEGGLAFLSDSLAVAGDLEQVKGAIARRDKAPSLNASTAEKLRRLSGAHAAWLVTTVPVSELAAQAPSPDTRGAMRGEVFQSIQETSLGLRFGATGVEMKGEAVMRSEKDAAALADVMRFLAGLAHFNRDGQNPGLALILETLQLRTESNVLKFTLSVPDEELEKFLRRNRPVRTVRFVQ